jgi:flagellar biosynthesis/type III secretory pathway M-ring protein FliF/YscJ
MDAKLASLMSRRDKIQENAQRDKKAIASILKKWLKEEER